MLLLGAVLQAAVSIEGDCQGPSAAIYGRERMAVGGVRSHPRYSHGLLTSALRPASCGPLPSTDCHIDF